MTWEEFIERGKHPNIQTWEDAFIIQAVAALSVQPQFENLHPQEVFEHIERTRQMVDSDRS